MLKRSYILINWPLDNNYFILVLLHLNKQLKTDTMAKILVTGATGNTCSILIPALISAGQVLPVAPVTKILAMVSVFKCLLRCNKVRMK